MSQKEIRDSYDRNQNRTNNVSFIFASGGLVVTIKIILSNTLAYSLIPIGVTILSWSFSLFYGLQFLINKGNYLSAAEYATKDNPVNIDNYKAPRYFRRQVYLLKFGGVFFLLWLIWRLLANAYSWFSV